MADIHNLIAAISPDIYCKPEKRGEVKKIVRQEGYLKAVEERKSDVIDPTEFDADEAKKSPLKAYGIKNAREVHKLTYDSMTESLEPIYFWILDFISKLFRNVEKLTDNFVASPGSAYFSEFGQRSSLMQDKAMSMLATVNTVLKSILNLLYDMKEFKIRLEVYDKIKNGTPAEKEAAEYSLKQIWMDNVDIKRGTTSIKGLVQQFDYVTIIDAFMKSRDEEHAKTLDLNDRVKRIIQQRVGEFKRWAEESEKELRKRYEIERQYLKSQYNTLQLYARWMKPYLDAAKALEQRASGGASLVTSFNTLMLELTLLATSDYKPGDDVDRGELPGSFKNIKTRTYREVLIIEFKFRGIPQRVGQGYSFGGKVDVTFSAYGLNNEEIDQLKKEMDKDNFKGMLEIIEGATKESLSQIQEDIDAVLETKKPEKKENVEDTNPFSSLFSFFKPEQKKEEKKDLTKGIKPDSDYEKILRSQAIISAREKCLTLFDTYKKAHQMAAYP